MSVEDVTDLDVAYLVAFGEEPDFSWLYSPSPNSDRHEGHELAWMRRG